MEIFPQRTPGRPAPRCATARQFKGGNISTFTDYGKTRDIAASKAGLGSDLSTYGNISISETVDTRVTVETARQFKPEILPA